MWTDCREILYDGRRGFGVSITRGMGPQLTGDLVSAAFKIRHNYHHHRNCSHGLSNVNYCKMHGGKWNVIEMSYESNVNVRVWFCIYKMPWDAVRRSRWMVQMYCEVVKWYKNMNAPPICLRHFGASAEMSVGHFGPFINVETVRHQCRSVPKTLWHRHKKVRHFGTKDIVPNCLRSEVSVHRLLCHKCWPTFFVGQILLAKFECILFLLANFPGARFTKDLKIYLKIILSLS